MSRGVFASTVLFSGVVRVGGWLVVGSGEFRLVFRAGDCNSEEVSFVLVIGWRPKARFYSKIDVKIFYPFILVFRCGDYIVALVDAASYPRLILCFVCYSCYSNHWTTCCIVSYCNQFICCR